MSDSMQFGTVAEVTREEARDLEGIATAMASHSKGRKTGWLGEYVRLHVQAQRILKRVIDRSWEDFHAGKGGVKGAPLGP